MILSVKKLMFVLFVLPLFSFAQKKETEKPKDSIKNKQELFYKFRHYNITPCNCPTTIELLKKLNKRKNKMKNPYKFTEKDSLKIYSKKLFL